MTYNPYERGVEIELTPEDGETLRRSGAPQAMDIPVAEIENDFCPYCQNRWLYSACWWQECRQWTCGDYACREQHNRQSHDLHQRMAELKRRSEQ